eukprot:15485862-Alexandrium_andersonii.AAC.1
MRAPVVVEVHACTMYQAVPCWPCMQTPHTRGRCSNGSLRHAAHFAIPAAPEGYDHRDNNAC